MWKKRGPPKFTLSRRRPDEHAMLINGGEGHEAADGGYLDESSAPRHDGINELDTQKRWQKVTIGVPTRIISRGDSDPSTCDMICVFPKGIQLILASNPSG